MADAKDQVLLQPLTCPSWEFQRREVAQWCLGIKGSVGIGELRIWDFLTRLIKCSKTKGCRTLCTD